MRPFWKKRVEDRAVQPMAETLGPDLLARQEEEAFVASVLKKRQEREAPVAAKVRPADPEPEEIEWSEQDDVYRPQRVRAAEFLAVHAKKMNSPFRHGTRCCFVRRAAFDKIQAHLRSDIQIELGGLLMGEAFYDAEQEFYGVVIEEALPAYDGEGTALTFSYTEATWQALSPQLQTLPSTWTLLGSFHSHPGMGVFLSSTDLETQRGIFFHDWQIALVIDPLSNAIGFFFGAEGHSCSHWELV
ncbi:MAG: Mov34/MPN/PAD family protein [Chthonomonadaceae bacterium]|nr:Mov34/MPN/PAD family protein [Chthonomonadaceae bacterium]